MIRSACWRDSGFAQLFLVFPSKSVVALEDKDARDEDGGRRDCRRPTSDISPLDYARDATNKINHEQDARGSAERKRYYRQEESDSDENPARPHRPIVPSIIRDHPGNPPTG